MNRRDRECWATARTLDDLGAWVVAWLNGKIRETPGHCGPPAAETIPLIPVLAAANRAVFITDNSQRADEWDWQWEAWVIGFASDDTLGRLRAAVAGTPLVLTACHGRHGHGYRPFMRRCGRRESVRFWSDKCPAVAAQLSDAWYVAIDDPEPGRNDRLWPALEAFSKTALQAQEMSRS